MDDTDDRVELADLDVIARYSLAVRAATADRDELIATLRSDLDWLEAGRRRRTPPAKRPSAPAKKSMPTKSMPMKSAAKKAAAKKATARKATGRRR